MQPLMKRAEKAAPKGAKFTAPDVSQFVPPEIQDQVQRVVAAGVKFIYSPQMREQVQKEIARDVPLPQKLAEATLGLMLSLDQQTKGGIPQAALFPAGMNLLGEAGEILSAAGQPVDQDAYNEAARILFVQMSKKLGMSDDDIMTVAAQAAGKGGQAAAAPEEAQSAEAQAQAAWDEEEPAA